MTAAERDAQESRQRAEARSKEVTHLLAESYVDQAQALCEQGEIGRGLLWFAHSLRCAPEEAVELRHMIRANLSAWASQLHRLGRVIRVDGEARAVAFSPDGSRMAVGSSFGTIRVWDVATGSPIGKPIRHVAWGGAFPAIDTFQGLVFSPDGNRILTASYENTCIFGTRPRGSRSETLLSIPRTPSLDCVGLGCAWSHSAPTAHKS